MSDVFIDQIEAMQIKCPVHTESVMVGHRKEIRTGYTSVIRAIMYMGVCPVDKCNKWFQYDTWKDVIIWP